MRILLSTESKKDLFNQLKKINNANTLVELSKKLNLNFGTLQHWLYSSSYLPEKIIPRNIISDLKILDRQEDNWGRIKGGKKTYQITVQKYGLEEIRKRQIKGGKNSIKNLKLIKEPENFSINLSNPLFLEFYGALLGDGWLSKFDLKEKNKSIWLIGISGHRILDKEYHLYLQKISKELFNRKGYIKEKPRYNARELQIGHKTLLKFFHEELNFPIGKKDNLAISSKIICLNFNYTRYVIRGLFDTDGSFFFDKTPVGRPYPIISLHMRAPIIISQIKEILLKQGFKPLIYHNGEELKLKGSIQLRKWMSEIGFSNSKHLNKVNALVAQLDSVAAS